MPINRNGYFRNFMIFEKEDSGLGEAGDPAGYIKLEGRDGMGKLSATVQNLKAPPENSRFKLYLIHMNNSFAISVHAGDFNLQKGRGELKWDFNTENVANTDIPIFDYNIAAVVAELKENGNSRIVCPLAAYKNGKANWRDKVLKASVTTNNEGLEMQGNILLEEDEYRQMVNAYEDNTATEASLETDNKNYQESYDVNMGENGNNNNTDNNSNSDKIENNIYEEEKFTCPAASQTNKADPCADCYAKTMHNQAMNEQNAAADIEKLKKNFDRYFNEFDPFNSKRRDYKWWKVDSPVNLNNILYQSNIRSPLLFNPIVMMAHFKFRHLAIGIYQDRSRSREYLVCGVPGVFGIDSKPFGDMCKWIQLEGNTQRYGAFGYWIVFIDPKSGKFLII